METGGHQDPAATAQNPTEAAGSEDYRFELADVSPPIPCDPASRDYRFELDTELFDLEIDPAPLFLQAAQ